MQYVTELSKCTGCEACFNICPVTAVKMVTGNTGFAFPVIDQGKCISCNKCQMVCPVENEPEVSQKTVCYAVINKDKDVRKSSSSGGLFRLIAEYTIENHGSVYGSVFDGEYNVNHARALLLEDVSKMQGAKYSQSCIGIIYKDVQNDLVNGLHVLFSGTPCQVAGLKNYLGKNHEKLITVDFICHGVPSPAVWQKYIQYRKKQDKSKVFPEKINMRSKVSGWNHYRYSVVFDYDTHQYQATSSADPYMNAFVSDQIIRESCSVCTFKGINRCSDITLGDFWGIENLHPEMSDDQGTSLLLIHSDKANIVWNSIKDKTDYLEVKEDETYSENPSLIRAARTSKNRETTIKGILNYGFEYYIFKQTLSKIKNRVIQKNKNPEKKIGIVTITNNQSGNYGNTLQNYAVQQVLKRLGYESETIRNLRYIEQRRFTLLYWMKLAVAKDHKSKRDRKFEHFKRKYIKQSSQYLGRGHEDYELLNKTYYKFVCGSDQVWNPNYRLNDNLKFNLMEFADPQKRIAYAASIGITQLPDKYIDEYKNALSDYSFISVREETAAEIIEKLTDIKPEVFIDPTLMLSSQEWLKVSEPVNQLSNKKYILKYCLGDTDENITETCNQLVKMLHAEIIDLSKKSDDIVFGPSEFIWLIKNAQYIVTDSFHGTIFSIIFNKQFTVFKRKGEDDKIFSRLISLLSLFGLQNRIADSNCTIIQEIYNVKTILEEEQSRVLKSLKTALQ